MSKKKKSALTGELGLLKRPGGGVSSEISITVEDPRLNKGRPTNIPTLVRGQVHVRDLLKSSVSPLQTELAIQRARVRVKRGHSLPSFSTMKGAVKAAEKRSKEKNKAVLLGKTKGPLPQDYIQDKQTSRLSSIK